MIDTMWADGPRADFIRETALFAPLIGSWDLEVDTIGDDGSITTVDGEWTFGWALDGRAVVDVWLSPARASRLPQSDGEWGASVRFFDPAIGAWRSTWHGPARGWVIPFVGRECDEGIELSGRRDHVDLRWVFSEITPTSFLWRAEEASPGEPVHVRQRFRARRACR